MDQSEVKHLEQAQRMLLPSLALRIGNYLRKPSRWTYLTPTRACALGAMYHAISGADEFPPEARSWKFWTYPHAAFVAKAFGVPKSLMLEVENMNMGKKSNVAIASWLERQGY